MSAAVSPVSAAEALGMLRSAMGYLSAADATAMAAETQAQCLLASDQHCRWTGGCDQPAAASEVHHVTH
jgi:hypothetical protein